jgi:putative transcriptional regulator
MSKGIKSNPFFKRLKTGLEEGIQFVQGKRQLHTTVFPAPPPEFRASDVVQLRLQLNLSQQAFARTLNVSTKTVQSWEQGSRRPSQAALRLLQVLRLRPEMVCEVVGVAGRHKSTAKR